MQEGSGVYDGITRLRLRYAGTCSRCGAELGAGTPALYDRGPRTVSCIECPPTGAEPVPAPQVGPAGASPVESTYVPRRAALPEQPIAGDSPPGDVDRNTGEPDAPTASFVDGVAGGGALREFERRHDAREKRIREDHPRTSQLRLALTDDPEHTRAWATGAIGEIRLGETLDSMAGPRLRVLHDRKPPRTRANIDHIVICPSGVFVVDSKRYRDQRPRLRAGTLYVGSRNQTKMLDGMHKQLEAVRSALSKGATDTPAEAGSTPEVPVRGVLCFIEADFPLIGGDFTVRGVEVLWPRKLYAKLTEPGPLDELAIGRIFDRLRTALPAYKLPAPEVPNPRLTEPPRRKLLPLLIKPLLSIALIGLMIWAFSSGAAVDLARILGEWFASMLVPGR